MERLQPWLADPRSAAVLLDFDGTLAPIVDSPPAARPLPGVVQVLEALTARYRLVAVVSGRPASFLARHLPVPDLSRWGAYGLERVLGDGSVGVLPAATRWVPVVAEVVSRARAAAPEGVGVEDKGVSVTIHTRTATSATEWAASFATTEAARTGLEVHPAKMSVELRPPLPVDKGSVVARLLDGSGVTAACFVGDDVGDLSAFAALDRVPVALRVAARSPESPPELLAAADLIVDGPEGVLALLGTLAGR